MIKKTIFFIILLSAMSSSCDDRDKKPYDPNDPNFWIPKQGDVYMAGWERSGQNYSIDGKIYYTSVAKVWKNGIAKNLTDGTNQAEARSVFVFNSDVYIVGHEDNGQSLKRYAKVWKNGVAQNLTDGINIAEANSVFVSDGIVYVAGRELKAYTHIAKVWKNGVAQNLTDGINHEHANAYSIYVSGDDVYVAGIEGSIPRLWKNGVVEEGLNYKGPAVGSAVSVYVSGNDVYVAGYFGDGYIWKNGELHSLPTRNQGTSIHSIFVSDDVVYVAGFGRECNGNGDECYDFATLWKNDVMQDLTEGIPSIKYGVLMAYALSVYVVNKDVYVAGYEKNMQGNDIVKFWKNGVAHNFSDGSYETVPYSIFVVE